MHGYLLLTVQVALATVLGAAIGMERELGAQSAGLRTHMLVSVGAALFSLVGMDVTHTDPTRIAAQVVTGIGFLGAGAILREGTGVRGLTTAASLWVTAAIGLAIGLRQFFVGCVTTAIAVGVLWLVKRVERGTLPGRRPLEVTLTLDSGARLDRVEAEAKMILPRAKVLRVSYAAGGQQVVMLAQPNRLASLTRMGDQLRDLEGVHGVDVSF